MTDTTFVDEYIDDARKNLQLLRASLVLDPSRDAVEATVQEGLGMLLKNSIEEDSKARMIKAALTHHVLLAYLDVVFNNPMYGSHALVLQWDLAISHRINEYRETLLRHAPFLEKVNRG